MSKRKLSKQQSARVDKIQKERARRAEEQAAAAAESPIGGELGPEQEGLVVANYGTQVAVESSDGVQQRCHLRANLEGLVTGDRVVFCDGDPDGVVVAQRDRQNVLSRPDNYGKLKPVAANIDQVIIVIAPYPAPHSNLINRYLVAVEAMAAEPVLLLNKTDLLEEDPAVRDSLETLLEVYPTLGYQLIRTSAKTAGLEELQNALQKKTSVFVGQSGVGKSSLVNALLPGAAMEVAALSEATGKGAHTTTTTRLLHLDCGGSLIDSPGIREFGLWHMTREQVEEGFREFRPLLGTCKFRDCRHEQEPDCAILQAVASGTISQNRLDSFRHIIGSLEDT